MPEPIHHETMDLYARIDGAEHIIGQARVPIYATLNGPAKNLRDRVVFTVGDPEVKAHEGWDAKGQGAKAALKEWRDYLTGELNKALVGEKGKAPGGATEVTPTGAADTTPTA